MNIDSSQLLQALSPVGSGVGENTLNNNFAQQDITRFENALQQAGEKVTGSEAKPAASAGLQQLLNPLASLNEKSQVLKTESEMAVGDDVKPSELMMLTMRAHEFMFQCELTANVANRSSDGVQQLFRQQS